MNPRTLGSSIWLLTVGAATVLLIGAFARFDAGHGEVSGAQDQAAPPAATVTEAPASETPPATGATVAPTLPSDLSPGLAEVIKLAQSHIAEETILAYVQNSGQTYSPSADEILYLSDLGLSEKVINALFKKPELLAAVPPTPAPTPAAVAPEPDPTAAMTANGAVAPPEEMMQPPPAEMAEVEPPPLQNPQDSYFYDSLSPYGSWVYVAGLGWCWQPMVASVNPNWMPYCDRGGWAYTDDGWYWASDYSWGWAAFHYGRWSREGTVGWVWTPGSVWAPAWVAWRNTQTHAGWAALPPGAYYGTGNGLFATPGLGGFQASFGLSASAFTFVPYDHFLSHSLSRYAARSSAALFASSTPVNNYSVAGRKIVNVGVSADLVGAMSKAPVRKLSLQDAASPAAASIRANRDSVAVFRPNVSAPAVQTASRATEQPVLINKQALSLSVDETMQRTFGPRPSSVSDYSGYTGRTGYATGNYQPSAKSAQTIVSGAPAANGAYGAFQPRRNFSSSEGSSASGYSPPSSYSPRGYSGSSAGPAYSAPPRGEAPSTSNESRGGGEVSRGSSSSASSTTSSSSSSSKNSK